MMPVKYKTSIQSQSRLPKVSALLGLVFSENESLGSPSIAKILGSASMSSA